MKLREKFWRFFFSLLKAKQHIFPLYYFFNNTVSCKNQLFCQCLDAVPRVPGHELKTFISFLVSRLEQRLFFTSFQLICHKTLVDGSAAAAAEVLIKKSKSTLRDAMMMMGRGRLFFRIIHTTDTPHSSWTLRARFFRRGSDRESTKSQLI